MTYCRFTPPVLISPIVIWISSSSSLSSSSICPLSTSAIIQYQLLRWYNDGLCMRETVNRRTQIIKKAFQQMNQNWQYGHETWNNKTDHDQGMRRKASKLATSGGTCISACISKCPTHQFFWGLDYDQTKNLKVYINTAATVNNFLFNHQAQMTHLKCCYAMVWHPTFKISFSCPHFYLPRASRGCPVDSSGLYRICLKLVTMSHEHWHMSLFDP